MGVVVADLVVAASADGAVVCAVDSAVFSGILESLAFSLRVTASRSK
jgi:hypothetical protein